MSQRGPGPGHPECPPSPLAKRLGRRIFMSVRREGQGGLARQEDGRCPMVKLELDVDEVEILRHVLMTRLMELRKEIAHTATRDYKGKLKAEEALVDRLLMEVSVPVTV